jgi:predicted Zn-dependent protease
MKYLTKVYPIFLAFCVTYSGLYAEQEPTLEAITTIADQVIDQSMTEYILAAKNTGAIFDAAKQLYDDGQLAQSRYYFEKGLELSPWNMGEQLNYAKLLKAMGETVGARSVSHLVFKTTERQILMDAAAQVGELTVHPKIDPMPEATLATESICIVRIGEVDDWIVQHSASMLSDKLGAPAYIHPMMIALPKPDRSYYNHWTSNLTKGFQWEHPYVIAQMNDIGIESEETATVDQKLELLARIAEVQGQTVNREDFEGMKRNAKDRDQQWNASLMLQLLEREIQKKDKVTYIGVTGADLYKNDSNYLFGTARTNGKYGVVSYCRFLYSFHNERENQKRFLERLHKQMLSTLGFALGVPRPTDPRSARSYPNGLVEHDLKGTWLSIQCIEGFEKALGHPLPIETKEASQKGMLSL